MIPLTAEILSDRHGYLLRAEVVELKRLASLLPPFARAVNVGAGMGTSGLALLESRSDLRLYSIDNVEGSMQREQRAFIEAGIRDRRRYVQILGDSRQIGQDWYKRGFEPVNLVFIDDGHTYPEVIGDIQSWLLNILAGGIMVIHDYRNKWDVGVGRAVDEGLAGYERLSLVEGMISFRIGDV